MLKTEIPAQYTSSLSMYDTQSAIGMIKRTFEDNLCASLSLKRISAPVFVAANTGLNDDLNGIERPVTFDIAATHTVGEVVHSLAKWKRQALGNYGFHAGKGLCTDMNAIRRDEELDNIHSIYVDQWDWEKVIADNQRQREYLKETVTLIVKAICDTLLPVKQRYPQVTTELCREVTFVTTQELLDMYPNLTPEQREKEITRKHKTVFLMNIGGKLSNGERHSGRAPDYDDWNLNGDLLFWHEPLQNSLEISSMGIRVSPEVLLEQLRIADCEHRTSLPFHKRLLENGFPQTMGGGIGQSRLCMLLLGKAHICEVQASIWDDYTLNVCAERGVQVL